MPRRVCLVCLRLMALDPQISLAAFISFERQFDRIDCGAAGACAWHHDREMYEDNLRDPLSQWSARVNGNTALSSDVMAGWRRSPLSVLSSHTNPSSLHWRMRHRHTSCSSHTTKMTPTADPPLGRRAGQSDPFGERSIRCTCKSKEET